MTPALESSSPPLIHSLSHFPSFTLVSIPRSFFVVASSRTLSTLAPCLTWHTCFLSTACFNPRSVGRRVRVGGDAGGGGEGRVLRTRRARGRKRAEKGGRKRRRGKRREREKDRTAAAGWSARAVEGTVGALNPFKYNQYRGVPSTLSVIWMIFTVHSYNPRRARAQMHTYAASLSLSLFRRSSPLFDREKYPLSPSAPPALIAVSDRPPSSSLSSTPPPFLAVFFIKNPPSCQRSAQAAIGPRIQVDCANSIDNHFFLTRGKRNTLCLNAQHVYRIYK